MQIAETIFKYFNSTPKNNTTSHEMSECANRVPSFLEGRYAKFQTHFLKYQQKEQKNRVGLLNRGALSPSLIDVQYMDPIETQCSANQRNLTSAHQQSLCPWRYLATVREDRFPASVMEARCTCRSCSPLNLYSLPASFYGCAPVLQTVPVLLKTEECDPDGFVYWKPSLEDLNMACVCSFTRKFVPVL